MSLSRARRLASLPSLSLAALVAGACVDFSGLESVGDLDLAGGRLEDIAVFPSDGAVVEVGDTVRLSAAGRVGGIVGMFSYDPVPDAAWSVSNASVARLEPLGPPPRDSVQYAQTLVRGVRPGTIVASAAARGIVGGTSVRVIPVVQRILLRPARDTALVGDTVAVYGVARDAAGDSVGPLRLDYEVTGSVRVLQQHEGNVVLIATSPGPAAVVARFRRATGTTTLTVLPRAPQPDAVTILACVDE